MKLNLQSHGESSKDTTRHTKYSTLCSLKYCSNEWRPSTKMKATRPAAWSKAMATALALSFALIHMTLK
jgi:hypothetical protein